MAIQQIERKTLPQPIEAAQIEAIPDRRLVKFHENLRLVPFALSQYRDSSIYQDAFQRGLWALWDCTKYYQKGKGTFPNYAVNAIRRAAKNELYEHGGVINLGQDGGIKQNILHRLESGLYQTLNREPNAEELATGIKAKIEEEKRAEKGRKHFSKHFSADITAQDITDRLSLAKKVIGLEEVHPTTDQKIIDVTADPDSPDPETIVLQRELSQLMKRVLDSLSPREAEVIRLKIAGLGYQEIANVWGVTRQAPRYFEARAFKKIRESGFANLLKEYY